MQKKFATEKLMSKNAMNFEGSGSNPMMNENFLDVDGLVSIFYLTIFKAFAYFYILPDE